MERVFEFSMPDFAKIVNTTTFVDNTLMIRDIFRESSRVLITAPWRFGKSTIVDMVKRFLEIEVDAIGKPKPAHTTKNYNLFKFQSLMICSDEEFFNKHCAKYPVMHIECAPLCDVHSFENMLDVFRNIVTNTFNQHIYLLIERYPPPIFEINRAYFDHQLIKNTDESDLVRSLEYLSQLLYRHFKKKVFVLIDDCDAFIYSVLFRNDNSDGDRIINFFRTTMGNLLGGHQYVERALLTGVLPVCADTFHFHRINVDCHYFLGNHRFFKYYGLTSDNFDQILSKLISDDAERSSTKQTIQKYYSGYTVCNQSIQVYSTWSVLQYLRKREVRSYLYNHNYIEGFKQAVKVLEFRCTLERLLLGDELVLDAAQSLSINDILQLKSVIMGGRVEGACSSSSSSSTTTFLQLLRHFGFLSINKVLDCGFVSLKIPNKEIKCELMQIVSSTQTVDCSSEAETDDSISTVDAGLCSVSETLGRRTEEINITKNITDSSVDVDKQKIEEFTFQEMLSLVHNGKALNACEQTESLKCFLKDDGKRTDVEIQLLVTRNTEFVCNISNLRAVVVEEWRSLHTNIHRYRSALYMLLCYHGFLVITTCCGKHVYFKLPNEEIRHRLALVLLEIDHTYNYEYPEYAYSIRSAVDLIQHDRIGKDRMLRDFGRAVSIWFQNENGLCDKNLLLPCLYVILLTWPVYDKTLFCRFDEDVILLKNKHRVAISITAIVDSSKIILTSKAAHAHSKSSKEHIFNKLNDISGTVAFGIGGNQKEIVVASSYCFKHGDSLQNNKITYP